MVDKIKFLIYGMGKTGVAVANLLSEMGGKIYYYDKADVQFSKEMEYTSRCGFVKAKALEDIDVLVLSPGVSVYDDLVKIAIKKNISVYSEMDIAMKYLQGVKIGITGSCGKSTTTKLIAEMLGQKYEDVRIGGNYGTPISSLVQNSDHKTISVIEVSSFMLESSRTFHFDCCGILNLSNNHLDRHKKMDKYLKVKQKIYRNSLEGDLIILPKEKMFHTKSKAMVKYFSMTDKKADGQIKDGVVTVSGKQMVETREFSLKGEHNKENLLFATMIAERYSVGPKEIEVAIQNFQGLSHRFEVLGIKKEIKYINDSKATSAKETETAIDMLFSPTVLMLGGSDKKDDFFFMMKKIKACEYIKSIVIFGETSREIISVAKVLNFEKYHSARNFEEAFNLANSLCKGGDTLLLSPACPSFDEFENFEKRGEMFKRKMENL